jgi:hypothetical protein
MKDRNIVTREAGGVEETLAPFTFNPFAKNPVAEDLIVRVDRARSKRVA